MWKVNRPAKSARETFTTCISNVENCDLKMRLQAATHAIVDASIDFEEASVQQCLHTFPREDHINGNVTKEEMGDVYAYRLAKKNSVGRYIYEELLSAPTNGRCPLCGHGYVRNLDHFMPKAHYPILAVTPLNLVPVCRDCNYNKRDRVPASPEEVPLNPYFDDIDGDRWLRAEVVQTKPTALRFYVDAPSAWSFVLKQRVNNQFKMLELAILYASEAADELLNIQNELEQLYTAKGADEVKAHLQDSATSRKTARQNGWRAAAYDAWATSPWFCAGVFRL